MNKGWAIYAVAAAVCLAAGCGKSDKTANQTPPAAAAPNSNTAANTPSTPTPTQPQATTTPAPEPMSEPAAAPVTPPQPPPPLVVASGTTIPVTLTTPISSYSNKPGDEFEGSVAASITVNGETAIPKGATVRGTVVEAKKQGKFKGEALLTIRLTHLTVNGKEYPISSSVYGGQEKGKGKRTAAVTGGSAAAGALIGGLAGGGKGAAIGAAVGGGGGLAVSGGTGGKNVNLPAETKINFKLTHSITIDRQ
jgi:hypothetical protein